VFCFPFQESSFEQLKRFSAAHKEKIPTDKIRNGNYRDRHTERFDDHGVIINTNSDEDIRRAHIPIKE
jgi:hypothetical protein